MNGSPGDCLIHETEARLKMQGEKSPKRINRGKVFPCRVVASAQAPPSDQPVTPNSRYAKASAIAVISSAHPE